MEGAQSFCVIKNILIFILPDMTMYAVI